MNAQFLIKTLQLLPHPEGGYYKETYRSDRRISVDGRERNVCTAIFFLLENHQKSHFHRIQSDELWFFHQGEPLEMVMLQDQKAHTVLLGNNLEEGESPQIVIPANTWFAAKIKRSTGYALVSCSVAPGFDFSDFELADEKELLQDYPHLKTVISNYTL